MDGIGGALLSCEGDFRPPRLNLRWPFDSIEDLSLSMLGLEPLREKSFILYGLAGRARRWTPPFVWTEL